MNIVQLFTLAVIITPAPTTYKRDTQPQEEGFMTSGGLAVMFIVYK
jgi:hypothetical protein